jgi:hypothetical protein
MALPPQSLIYDAVDGIDNIIYQDKIYYVYSCTVMNDGRIEYRTFDGETFVLVNCRLQVMDDYNRLDMSDCDWFKLMEHDL